MMGEEYATRVLHSQYHYLQNQVVAPDDLL